MKAASYSRFGGPEVLEIVDLPEPHPGPGEIRIAVRACGVNQTDCKRRQGVLGGDLPQTLGNDVAGIVDELGEGVTDVAVGDRVFGFTGAGAAEYTLLAYYAPMPPALDFAQASVLPVSLEVATRTLDVLGVQSGTTLLINGSAGGIGSAAIQLAVGRGARVIGVDAPETFDYLRALGAEPVPYGDGLAARVRDLAPDGVDAVLHIAGKGVLPELIEIAGRREKVVTIADEGEAKANGVKFSKGEDGRAIHAITEVGALIEAGTFSLPVGKVFPLSEIGEAHRASESGAVRGKIALLVG